MSECEKLILSVIRGEKLLSDLKSRCISLKFRAVNEGSRIREILATCKPSLSFSVAPTALDLAMGLHAYQDQPQILKEWGSFVLCADLIDLQPLELESEGELILGAVWDATFDGRFSQEVAQAVATLAHGGQH